MSNHQTALVPIETWAYQSPELRFMNRQIDVGLLAESLIYYDSILLNFNNQPQLAELLRYFLKQDALNDFLSLVSDNTINIYEYSFISAPVLKDGNYILLNMQDSVQAQVNTFEQRFLYHQDIESLFPKARHRMKLYKAFRDHVIEVKADQFGAAVENARDDYIKPPRAAHLLQTFIDELYAFRQLGKAPNVTADVTHQPGTYKIHFNINLDEIAILAGKNLNIHNGTPLHGCVISNRLIWSAANQRCDLYLPSPISSVVGDKLYEASQAVNKTRDVISQLQASVEFPNIRSLVNSNKLPFSEVLKIRKKSRRFRDWLQNESDRDRDAIIAYHHEVARDAGLLSFGQTGRKALSLLGVIGGGAIGGVLGHAATDASTAAAASVVGSVAGYLADIGSLIGADWKPVVFGNWMKDRIAKILNEG